MDKNYVFFMENIEDLYEEYGDSFLVIKDQRVVGAYLTYQIAVDEAIKIYKPGTFIVQKCAENQENLVAHFLGVVS